MTIIYSCKLPTIIKGTELGLAVCYRIVRRHAATIIIESEFWKGITFTIGFQATILKTLSSSEDIQKTIL